MDKSCRNAGSRTARDVKFSTETHKLELTEKVPIFNIAVYPQLFVAVQNRLIIDDNGFLVRQAGNNIVRDATLDNPARLQIDHVMVFWRAGKHWCDAYFCGFAGEESWRSSVILDCHDGNYIVD